MIHTLLTIVTTAATDVPLPDPPAQGDSVETWIAFIVGAASALLAWLAGHYEWAQKAYAFVKKVLGLKE